MNVVQDACLRHRSAATNQRARCGGREVWLDTFARSIPILKIQDTLIASIQIDLRDVTAVQFKDDLLNEIHRTKARGLIVDLTSIEIVDSFIGRLLNDIAAMAKLMGTRVVISGMNPAVAITLVELGLELNGVMTALNLEKGLTLLQRQAEEREDGAG